MNKKGFAAAVTALTLALSMGAAADRPFASPGDRLDPGMTYDILNEDNLAFENMDRDDISSGNYTLEYHLDKGEEAVKSLRINAYEATVELTTEDVIPVDGLVEITGQLTLTSRKRTNSDGSWKTLTYDIDFTVEGDGEDAAEEEEGDGLTPSERLLRQWGYEDTAPTAGTAASQTDGQESDRNPDTGRGALLETALKGVEAFLG